VLPAWGAKSEVAFWKGLLLVPPNRLVPVVPTCDVALLLAPPNKELPAGCDVPPNRLAPAGAEVAPVFPNKLAPDVAVVVAPKRDAPLAGGCEVCCPNKLASPVVLPNSPLPPVFAPPLSGCLGVIRLKSEAMLKDLLTPRQNPKDNSTGVCCDCSGDDARMSKRVALGGVDGPKLLALALFPLHGLSPLGSVSMLARFW